MVIVTMGNSYSRVTGLDIKQMQGLRKVLSYNVDFNTARFIPNPANRVKYCIDAKGNFATGLLSKVETYLLSNHIEYTVHNICDYDRPCVRIKRPLKHAQLSFYPAQLDALRAAENTIRGTISMPTGTGKSYVIMSLVERLEVKTLIIVPTLELKSQLTTTLSQYLTSMEGITIENIDSNALAGATDYDCLIIDECHRSAAKTYRDLNKRAWKDIRYRYCFSATPFRNNKEEQLLYEGICGEVIYSLSYEDSVKEGYIVPVEAYYYELPKVKPEGYTYSQVYSELIVNNEVRNLLISAIITSLYHQGKYCLCLVKEVAHGKILSEMTGIPFVNGADEESRQWIETFKEGRLKVLIATEGLLGEGIDTKPCEYVVLCGIGKARSALMQKIGRTVRRYPGKLSGKIVFFKDKSHKFTLTHFKEECKIIEQEYNTVPVRLED